VWARTVTRKNLEGALTGSQHLAWMRHTAFHQC
jgi:hypothetical protein